MDNNDLQTVLANLVQRIGSAGEKYGPQALDLVGQYQHWMAIFHLFVAVICMLMSVGMFFLAKLLFSKHVDIDNNPTYAVGGIFSGLVGASISLIGICDFCNVEYWVAAMSSKLALVQLVVQALHPASTTH